MRVGCPASTRLRMASTRTHSSRALSDIVRYGISPSARTPAASCSSSRELSAASVRAGERNHSSPVVRSTPAVASPSDSSSASIGGDPVISHTGSSRSKPSRTKPSDTRTKWSRLS